MQWVCVTSETHWPGCGVSDDIKTRDIWCNEIPFFSTTRTGFGQAAPTIKTNRKTWCPGATNHLSHQDPLRKAGKRPCHFPPSPPSPRVPGANKKPAPTCEPQRGVFVQGDQRGVEEHGVIVFGHYAMIGGLEPRLMLVRCILKRQGNTAG